MEKVRVRFAPSPTGYLHIGSLRTALYDYLYAKQKGGDYVLRVEDTDRTRLVDDATEKLIDILVKLGVPHNEGPILNEDGNLEEIGEYGPYVQSDRLDIYKKYIDELVEKDKAYYCFCTKERLDEVREFQKSINKVPKYDGHCRSLSKEEIEKRIAAGESYVIRMKLTANTEYKFVDPVRGEVKFNTNDVDDQVLMKSDGFPTYHLAVVVDDHLMKISHVFRGEEWLSSTPKQLFLFEAFGWEVPEFVHLPTILNKDKKKLSKRQGDVSVEDFIDKGYLKEGLINYLALVGWSPESNQEIFELDELIEQFDLKRVSKSGGIFDLDKLNWVNAQHIKTKDIKYITDLAIPFLEKEGYDTSNREWVETVVDTVRPGISYLAELKDHVAMFYNDGFEFENEEAREVMNQEHIIELLNVFKAKLEAIDEIDDEFTKTIFKTLQTETGAKGKGLYMPMRVAITGQCHGPEMGAILKLFGKAKTISNVCEVIEKISK